MENQQNNFEENKDRMGISEAGFNSASIQNYPTKIRFTSILLSVAFYLSIIYLVFFISYFALSGNAWGLFILIFLGPNLLSIAIGAIFLRIGMEKGNKALLYTSFLLYMLSIILAYDPDWGVYRIAPIVLGILVLIGTLLAKEDKEVLRY